MARRQALDPIELRHRHGTSLVTVHSGSNDAGFLKKFSFRSDASLSAIAFCEDQKRLAAACRRMYLSYDGSLLFQDLSSWRISL